jgi:hypothetical protein
MAQYERIHAAEEIGERRHHQSIRSERRALAVYRNSVNGWWSRYASNRKRSTLYQTAMRLRDRPEWLKYGTPEIEYRYDRWHRVWVMFVRFAEPAMDALELRDAITAVGGEATIERMKAATLPPIEEPGRAVERPRAVAVRSKPEPLRKTIAEELAEQRRAAEEQARRDADEAERLAWLSRGLVQGGVIIEPGVDPAPG